MLSCGRDNLRDPCLGDSKRLGHLLLILLLDDNLSDNLELLLYSNLISPLCSPS
jgi:hypothetical protein